MKHSIERLRSQGHTAIADALERLAEAVAKDKALDGRFRDQLSEQLEFLAQQSILPKSSRKSGLIGPVFMALAVGVRSTKGLAKLWHELEPLFARALDYSA